MSDMPGPDEEVIARLPEAAAPMTMLIEAISLSAGMKTPFTFGSLRARYSGMSFCGVIG
jgi:hypothetical protein